VTLAGFFVPSKTSIALARAGTNARHASWLLSSRKEAAMPAWLEVMLNLAGYVGFLALAARSSRVGHSNDDHICGDKT
jgi:hypothetical protein